MPQRTKLKPIASEEALFDHWKNLPVIQEIYDPEFFRISRDLVRTAILKVLRVGIMDAKYNKKRHLLRAKELLEHVNIELDEDAKIGLSKLYYHLEKLEAVDHINHLAIVKGNHRIKYYTRNAKFYLYDTGDFKASKTAEFVEPIRQLAQYLNPELSDEYFKDRVNIVYDIVKGLNDKLVTWVKKNEEVLHELDIDALELFTSFNLVSWAHQEVQNAIKPIFNILNDEFSKEL